jgi:hypothetical protein
MPVSRAEVREMALALPQAVEMDHRRAPSYRVNGRIFCMIRPDEPFVVLKLDRDDQLNMFEGYPDAITPAQHYAHHGWTRLWLEPATADLARTLLRLAWTHVAPKRLAQSTPPS